MFAQCLKNIQGILINPLEKFEELKSSSLSLAYQQYFLLLVVYSVLFGIVTLISNLLVYSSYEVQAGAIPVIGSFLIAKLVLFKSVIIEWSIFFVYLWFLSLVFLIFIKGLFLHVFVILFGGEQGVKATLLAILFASTPFLLLGWIPYIGIIGLIWAVVLCIIGVKVLQDLPWWKAAGTIVVPAVLLIIGLLLGRFFIFFLTDALISLM